MIEKLKHAAYCFALINLWTMGLPIALIWGLFFGFNMDRPYKMKHYDSGLHQEYLDDRASSSYRGY